LGLGLAGLVAVRKRSTRSWFRVSPRWQVHAVSAVHLR